MWLQDSTKESKMSAHNLNKKNAQLKKTCEPTGLVVVLVVVSVLIQLKPSA